MVSTCILVKTGEGQYDNGYLDVSVDVGDGYNMVTTAGINYDKGSNVLDECFVNLKGVQVSSQQTNAWAGRIETSVNNKVSYIPMKCLDCDGTVDTTEYIVVDGDNNGKGDTKCLDGIAGNTCTLVARLPNMLVIVGDNGVPSSAFPLQECEGDCDTDEDCDLDLICQLRDDYEEVPGCIGKGTSGEDYCRSAAPGPGVTDSPSKSPITPEPTPSPSDSPVTSEPTPSPSKSPVTSEPTPSPSSSPVTSDPTPSPSKSPITSEVTNSPSKSPVVAGLNTCLRITTGTSTFDSGFLDVSVDQGDGNGYVNVTNPGINYPAGLPVLEECYPELVAVEVSNQQTNAWGGKIEASIDGGATYIPMKCLDCSGTVDITEYIVVDGDGNGFGDTKCLDGQACKLVLVSHSHTYVVVLLCSLQKIHIH